MKIPSIFATLIVFQLVKESQNKTFPGETNVITASKSDDVRKVNNEVKMIPFKSSKRKLKGRSILPKKKRPPTLKDPWKDPDPQFVHTYAAMTATLNCTARGHPKPTVKWFRNGEEIINEEDRP